jgi:cytochrome P450
MSSIFDHNEDNHRAGIEPTWARMRQLETLPYTSAHGGYYIVTKYPDVVEALRNPATYSSAHGVAILDLHVGFKLLPLESDPPLHREYRRLVNQ